MINLLKNNLIFIILIGFTPFSTYADCDHCYIFCEVKLVTKDDDERIGYMPIYRGYTHNDTIDTWDELKAGADLRKFLLPPIKNITFVETYYSFEKIGSLVAEEEIEQIEWDSIRQLTFRSNDGIIGGAGPLPNLPLRSINKLKNNTILNVEIVDDGSTADIIYVNLNPNYSAEEFKLITQYSLDASNGDEFYSLYNLVRRSQDSRNQYRKTHPLDRIVNYLGKSIDRVEGRIENILQKETTKMKFLTQLNSLYEKRLKAYKAIESFIKDGDLKGVKEFADKEISDKKTREKLYAVINRSDEDKLSTLKEILESIKYLLLYGNFLENNDIIVYSFSWD
jgi:hypothetical protein